MTKQLGDSIYTSAIIVAGGKGTRMNTNTNKQFILLNNTPLLAHTIRAFEDSPIINEIILVINNEDLDLIHQDILYKYSFSKIKITVSGGLDRQASVFNGLSNISNSTDVVCIHDGARPFVTSKIIADTVYAGYTFSSAVCAVKVKDTIKTSTPTGFIHSTLDRDSLWSIQTPQTFHPDVIIAAHQKAKLDNFLGSDDAVLVERIGIKTKIVEGSYYNIKITTPEDLSFANAILNSVE